MEVRMLFKFYERILELEGNARFFKDAPLTDDKVNDLKNANALNLKLYSDESNTQVMSFSINEEDFGKIRYRSSSFQSLIDPSFTNINDFLL
jgi:ssRNA-specific RNase YbeY (16S rRNA maturation enzyme)